MKFFASQLTFFLKDAEVKKNIRALSKSLIFIGSVILIYALGFLTLKSTIEGEQYTFWTALYWTIVTMTTLGYGDIIFTTDLGRMYSAFVLFSGVVLLLIVLPFAFIRYFYAPWLEAQLRLRAPRSVPEETKDHVIITHFDSIAPGLIIRLKMQGVHYVVIHPDMTEAARLHGEGVTTIFGEIDSKETYEAACVARALLLVANGSDQANTNTALTAREVSGEVPIVATAESPDSVDLLELAGCQHVLPLKKWLGEFLANRINAGRAEAHVIGSYRGLRVAEFPVHNTPMVGRTIRDTKLREVTGLSIVGVWHHGVLDGARPDYVLTDHCVPVVVGTGEQLDELDSLLAIYDFNPNPVIVIGGGKVGRAATRALRDKDVPVNIIERKPELREKIGDLPTRLFAGDAADHRLLYEAGINAAPSVILTTNDDAMNIYLAVYCRRLNPDLRIVSRITYERNIEAIHRAGADFVLSYASLGVGSINSILQGREVMILGEGVDFFYISLPVSLEGKTLAESGIGSRTGLSVIALQKNGEIITNPRASTVLDPGIELLMMGSTAQREQFSEYF